jgi:anti-sigma factor RsiW
MTDDREHLLRLLEGDLSPQETHALDERLAADPELRRRLESLRTMRDAMRAGRAESFSLGFAERVLGRLEPAESSDDALYRALGWVFRRAAIASLIAATLFGALNMAHYQDFEVSSSTIESIFGLPTVTLDDALTVEPV